MAYNQECLFNPLVDSLNTFVMALVMDKHILQYLMIFLFDFL